MSRTSAQRILQDDLGCRPYKYLIEPALTEEHKKKDKKICQLGTNKFSKAGNIENSVF